MEHQNQETLFNSHSEAPLPQQLRPRTLEEIVGQEHFLNKNFIQLLKSDRWSGFIFWGPPGTGKTTLASVIAHTTQRHFESRSAVTAGVKEFRHVLEKSTEATRSGLPSWILFIDEVHRLNKAQQDVLLPYIEDGSIRFIGATTENPSFEINNAICSRCVVFHFKPLKKEPLEKIVRKGLDGTPFDEEVVNKIAEVSLGDARRALTLVEHLKLSAPGQHLDLKAFEKLSHAQSLYYDKKSESHYDTISAFIKSVRGSDPDAALYYLARMIEGGEDPKFIARRLIILASEDIGNASPLGLVLANNAFQAVENIGMPEGRIILSQVTIYLACCEKSNRSYTAIDKALEMVRTKGELEIPYSLRNAVTKQMKQWGYGEGYQYAHKSKEGWVPMQFLPNEIKGERFYSPTDRGTEKKFKDYLDQKRE